jgi:hypothetical protein
VQDETERKTDKMLRADTRGYLVNQRCSKRKSREQREFIHEQTPWTAWIKEPAL